MENESLLIEKAALGDEESFSILINNYKNYVFAIILNFIKNYDEAENVAQDVFFQIFVSLPKYDQNNFKAWLGRITTNKSIDCLRKKKAKFNEEALGEDNNSVDAAANPEIILLEKYNREKLKKALDGIPDIYRVTL